MNKDLKIVFLIFAGIMLSAFCLSILSSINKKLDERQEVIEWLHSFEE